MSVWTRGADREASAPLLAAVVALVACAPFILGSTDFPLDDAWIHLAYAKSLRLGEGLSYNPGDWETGFSSPLWAVLLAAWPTGTSPVIPVKLLGALLHAGTTALSTVLVMGLARARATEERPVPVLALGLVAGALVGTNPILIQTATSGMEVPLAALLLAALSLVTFQGRTRAAWVLGVLATWARPEAVPFALALGGSLAALDATRRRTAGAAMAGAVLGLALWVIYCLVVSGYPWPNTQYVKGQGGGLAGLTYLVEEVLPWHAWLVSLGGVILLGLAVRSDVRDRRPEGLVLLAAGVGTLLAIALTRPLHPGVELYESRYFAIVAWVFPVVLSTGLLGLRTWLAGLLILPLAVATGLLTSSLHARTRALEDDTRVLHREVAQWVSTNLDPHATIAVEGAGALRYFTPRSMRVVDLIGLNDRTAAHLHDDRDRKLCYLAQTRPDAIIMPADWARDFAPVFQLEVTARFEDPVYTQVRPYHPQTVVVFRVPDVTPAAREVCGGLGYSLAPSP